MNLSPLLVKKTLKFFFVSVLVSPVAIEEAAFYFEMEERCWILLSCSTFIPEVQADWWLKSHCSAILGLPFPPLTGQWKSTDVCWDGGLWICLKMVRISPAQKCAINILDTLLLSIICWTVGLLCLLSAMWKLWVFLTPGDKLIKAPWLWAFQ